jgi:hypothetical protein
MLVEGLVTARTAYILSLRRRYSQPPTDDVSRRRSAVIASVAWGPQITFRNFRTSPVVVAPTSHVRMLTRELGKIQGDVAFSGSIHTNFRQNRSVCFGDDIRRLSERQHSISLNYYYYFETDVFLSRSTVYATVFQTPRTKLERNRHIHDQMKCYNQQGVFGEDFSLLP